MLDVGNDKITVQEDIIKELQSDICRCKVRFSEDNVRLFVLENANENNLRKQLVACNSCLLKQVFFIFLLK